MPIWPGFACRPRSSSGMAIRSSPVANVETNSAAMKAPLRLRMRVAAMFAAYPVVYSSSVSVTLLRVVRRPIKGERYVPEVGATSA
jgi:hypothetical protein